jgi:hypothetical protein
MWPFPPFADRLLFLFPENAISAFGGDVGQVGIHTGYGVPTGHVEHGLDIDMTKAMMPGLEIGANFHSDVRQCLDRLVDGSMGRYEGGIRNCSEEDLLCIKGVETSSDACTGRDGLS